MKVIQIERLPKKKKKAICVYDTTTNTNYVVGYINNYEDLFIEALTSVRYIKGEEYGKKEN